MRAKGKTKNKRKGLPEKFIEQLEIPSRLSPTSPTVTVCSGETIVQAETFYGGVRQMVEHFSRDIFRMQAAQTFSGYLLSDLRDYLRIKADLRHWAHPTTRPLVRGVRWI